jgi:hypothetical protein
VVIERREPVAGPIRLGCLTVEDVGPCIAADLRDLEVAALHLSEGRVRSVYVDLLEERLARLRACGVVARLEPVQ